MCKIVYRNSPEESALRNGKVNIKTRCMCQGYTRWDSVRYCIEQGPAEQADAATSRPRDKYIQSSCVVGYRATDVIKHNGNVKQCTPLSDDDDVNACGVIILMRIPVPRTKQGRGAQPAYIPEEIRNEHRVKAEAEAAAQRKLELSRIDHEYKQKIQSAATEEERLRLLMDHTAATVMGNQPLQHKQKHRHQPPVAHPSDSYIKQMHGTPANEPSTTKPYPGYVCYCCLLADHHYRNECPRQDDPAWIPVDRRRAPTGIPKSSLRVATADEVGRAPYYDRAKNTFYVLSKIRQDTIDAGAPPAKRQYTQQLVNPARQYAEQQKNREKRKREQEQEQEQARQEQARQEQARQEQARREQEREQARQEQERERATHTCIISDTKKITDDDLWCM